VRGGGVTQAANSTVNATGTANRAPLSDRGEKCINFMQPILETLSYLINAKDPV